MNEVFLRRSLQGTSKRHRHIRKGIGTNISKTWMEKRESIYKHRNFINLTQVHIFEIILTLLDKAAVKKNKEGTSPNWIIQQGFAEKLSDTSPLTFN